MQLLYLWVFWTESTVKIVLLVHIDRGWMLRISNFVCIYKYTSFFNKLPFLDWTFILRLKIIFCSRRKIRYWKSNTVLISSRLKIWVWIFYKKIRAQFVIQTAPKILQFFYDKVAINSNFTISLWMYACVLFFRRKRIITPIYERKHWGVL